MIVNTLFYVYAILSTVASYIVFKGSILTSMLCACQVLEAVSFENK